MCVPKLSDSDGQALCRQEGREERAGRAHRADFSVDAAVASDGRGGPGQLLEPRVAVQHASSPRGQEPSRRKYTEEMLLEWKEEAEHELREKFNGIDRYSYTDIQDMIKLATSQGTEVIMSGIDELGTKVDSATAKVLTVLYEQFTDKRRDYEVAAMLNTASERLASGNFAETVHTLNGAVGRLGNFSDDAGQLNAGASMLENFPLHAFLTAASDAKEAAKTLDNTSFDTGPDTHELSHAVAHQVTATLSERDEPRPTPVPQRLAPAPVESSFDTKHVFLTGLGLGVVLCVLLIWAAVWLTQGP